MKAVLFLCFRVKNKKLKQKTICSKIHLEQCTPKCAGINMNPHVVTDTSKYYPPHTHSGGSWVKKRDHGGGGCEGKDR